MKTYQVRTIPSSLAQSYVHNIEDSVTTLHTVQADSPFQAVWAILRETRFIKKDRWYHTPVIWDIREV